MKIKRPPDFTIGEADNPYLLRWYIIPRNRLFNIYLHKMLRDDDDRALHDHPWWNVSIVLRGGYWEIKPTTAKYQPGGLVAVWRGPGAVVFRLAKAAHRLQLPIFGVRSWSLFITGPKFRTWGFHCPKGWIPWQQFVDQTDHGNVGKGCGE